MELSCFLLDDLLSCLKEFSSSASPSPHQDGWPYKGVPRGSAVTSPEADAKMHTDFLAKNTNFSVALTAAHHDEHVYGKCAHAALHCQH